MKNPFARTKTKSLAELCDEYLDIEEPRSYNEKEVWGLRLELGGLMNQYGIEYIARKDTLLECRVSGSLYIAELSPLNRLGPDVFSENAKTALLISLVDKLLGAAGEYERNCAAQKKLAWLIVVASRAENRGMEFVYRGYRFALNIYGTYAYIFLNQVTDLDG